MRAMGAENDEEDALDAVDGVADCPLTLLLIAARVSSTHGCEFGVVVGVGCGCCWTFFFSN